MHRANRQALVLVGDHWRSPHLAAARRPCQRASGVHRVPPGWGVMLRTRSVHGFGLRSPLGLVVLDRSGLVTDVRVLRPGRAVWLGAPSWVAELPHGWPLPQPGERLRVGAVRRLAGCPDG